MATTTMQISRSDSTRMEIVKAAATGQVIPSSGPATVTLGSDGTTLVIEIVD